MFETDAMRKLSPCSRANVHLAAAPGIWSMPLPPMLFERRSADAQQRDSSNSPETRPVLVGGELAGLLVGFEQGWRFRSLRRRFDALNDGVFCRADDAVCAARGIAALESPRACLCAGRSDAADRASAPRRALLLDLHALLERDAA